MARSTVLVNNVGDFLLNIKPFEQTGPCGLGRALLDQPETRVRRHARRDPAAASRRERREHHQRLDDRGVSRHPVLRRVLGVQVGDHGFTKSLALELGPAGIRVNAIAPETTETEQVKPSLFIQPQYREHIPRWIPLGRFGLPSDVAGCAVFLATDLSAWVTGTTLHVDGGALAAGGFYRTPQGQWTNVPVVSDNGIAF
jgi:hypothetical protein